MSAAETGAKEKALAVRLTAAELAALDRAVARFRGGALAPSRSQMIRVGLALGLERLAAMQPEELGRVLLGLAPLAGRVK